MKLQKRDGTYLLQADPRVTVDDKSTANASAGFSSVQMAPIQEIGAASSSDVAVAEPLPNAVEAGKVSQEAVPNQQGQPPRAVEPDDWALKMRKRLHNDNDTFTCSHTYRWFVGVQHACLEKTRMIRIGDGKTQESLNWTLLRLIIVTFQQRSVCSTRS